MTEFMFQGGRKLRNIVVTTAGNVATTLTPGAGKRWLLLYGRLSLSTDATVANRNLRIQIRTSAGSVLYRFPNGVVTPAGGATALGLIGNPYFDNAVRWEDATISVQGIIIDQTDQLYIDVNNGVAGDGYGGSIIVLEINV